MGFWISQFGLSNFFFFLFIASMSFFLFQISELDFDYEK